MKTSILIATSIHPWDDVRVKSKIGDSLLASGFDITWVGPDRRHYATAEREKRITYSLRRYQQGYVYRLAMLPWLIREVRSFPPHDFIYIPDPDVALVSKLLVSGQRTKIWFDIHEEFHRGPLTSALGGRRVPLLEHIVLRLMRKAAKSADVTTAVSRRILDTYALPSGRRAVLMNSAPTFFLGPLPLNRPEHFRVFHGKGTASHGTRVLATAIDDVNFEDTRVVMFPTAGDVGDEPLDPGLSEFMSARAKSIFEEYAVVPHNSVPAIMDTCHLGVIGYGRALGETSMPNRLFEYMARGLAVMAPSYATDIAEILAQYDCGLVVDFESPEEVAGGLRWAAANRDRVTEMGENGRRALENHFSWDASMPGILDILTLAK